MLSIHLTTDTFNLGAEEEKGQELQEVKQKKLGKFGKLVETTKRVKVGSQGNRKEIKRQRNPKRKLERKTAKHPEETLFKRKEKMPNPKQEHQPAWRLAA